MRPTPRIALIAYQRAALKRIKLGINGGFCTFSLARQILAAQRQQSCRQRQAAGSPGQGENLIVAVIGHVFASGNVNRNYRTVWNKFQYTKKQGPKALSEFRNAVLFCYFLRRATPTSPIKPEPNSHTAAGTGMTAAVVPINDGAAS